MKDPHVDHLIYRIEHGPFVTYENAKPMELELPDFRLRAGGAKVYFEMKGHYRTVEQARRAVEPFAKAWVLDVTFRKQRGWFDLVYENSQVIDRATGSTSQGVAIQIPKATLKVNPQSLEEFPTLPPDMLATPDVQSMFDRYVNSMNGREPLPSMAKDS